MQGAPRIFNDRLLPGGDVLIRQPGTPGAAYHVEATTNSVAWRPIGTATANANGYFELTDTNCAGSAMKFYRFWKSP